MIKEELEKTRQELKGVIREESEKTREELKRVLEKNLKRLGRS